jgi:hypothetical protein
MSVKIDIDDTHICRICLEDDTIHNLIYPCKCNGNIKFIHNECLNKWCNNQRKICEICKYEFKKIGKLVKYFGFLNRIREEFNYMNYSILSLIVCLSMMFYLIDTNFNLSIARASHIYDNFLQNTRIYYYIIYSIIYCIICIHHILQEIIQLNNKFKKKYIKLTFNLIYFISYIIPILYYNLGWEYSNIFTDIVMLSIIYIITLRNHINSIDIINKELDKFENYLS